MTEAAPTDAELIRRAIASRLADVHVSMPGIVVSYDAATQTARVQPALRRVLFDSDDARVIEEIPPLENVPVVFPSGSKLSLHFGLVAGDSGDLVFATNSINEWQNTGRVSTPGSLKLHDLGAAKFYPGLRARPDALPDTDESIGVPGGQRLHFTALGASMGTGAEAVATADKLIAHLQDAADAAAAAAVPNDGGKAAFGVFKSTLSALAVGASNLKADP